MVALKRNNGLDFSMCNQKVSVFHREPDGQITKTVHERAFLDQKKVRSVDKTGSKDALSFLLVIPGDAKVFVGDKVVLGDEVEAETDKDWVSLIPAKVSGLCVVSYVDTKFYNGVVSHVEAGG